jgi:parallel beta-helix repeat protein
MKTRLTVLCFCILHAAICGRAAAQGSLTPPGAPAPTMKTLDDVRPGVPISSLPITITNPGVYYLTRSLSVSGNGVNINTNDVTLDLCGFTMTGVGAGVAGVQVNVQNRVTIRNGTIRNFSNGIFIIAPATNTLIEGMLLHSNLSNGISIEATASVIRDCRFTANAAGFNLSHGYENVIEDCVAIENRQIGFLVAGTNNLIIRNIASGNPVNDYSIGVSNRLATIVTPPQTTVLTNTGGGTGATDPFANLRY